VGNVHPNHSEAMQKECLAGFSQVEALEHSSFMDTDAPDAALPALPPPEPTPVIISGQSPNPSLSPARSIVHLELSDSDSDSKLDVLEKSLVPSDNTPESPTKRLKQSVLNFPKVGHQEHQELEHKRALKHKAEDEALGELESKLNEEKILKKHLKANEKKRQQ
ncbi:hypothetical protein FRC11_011562, partial [Ceratobasidium sp. 423]